MKGERSSPTKQRRREEDCRQLNCRQERGWAGDPIDRCKSTTKKKKREERRKEIKRRRKTTRRKKKYFLFKLPCQVRRRI